MKILGETNEVLSGAPPSQSTMRARGPAEDQLMRLFNCYVIKEEFLTMCTELKDETMLTIILSLLSFLYNMFKKGVDTGYTDMYTYLWRPSLDSKISINTDEVLSVLEPLCRTCLILNPRNMGWLRMMADLCFAEHNYKTSMRYYLEIGTLSTNCFSRSVPFNIWDEKVYKHLLACLEKEKAFTMALVLCQFF